MELNGALSNPFTTDKGLLIRLAELRSVLLRDFAGDQLAARDVPVRPAPVLSLVTRVLEAAGRPMRACEIYAAATALYGAPIRWGSVKQALSANTIGGDQRFRRIGRGLYVLVSAERGA
jgi:hypothetical protein